MSDNIYNAVKNQIKIMQISDLEQTYPQEQNITDKTNDEIKTIQEQNVEKKKNFLKTIFSLSLSNILFKVLSDALYLFNIKLRFDDDICIFFSLIILFFWGTKPFWGQDSTILQVDYH